MSLLINAKENQIANIENEKGKKEGSLSFSESTTGEPNIELEDGFRYQLIPRPTKSSQRNTLFIAGEAGAGKSYFVREYAKRYKTTFPKNSIYLISYLDEDETLDAYKEIIRLNAFQPEFLDECLEEKFVKTEFSDSLVIFDDLDSIVNKKTKTQIYGLINIMLRLGRHYGTSVAYVGHELYASPELKCILNESQTITFFPKFLSYKKLRYLLEVYFGLSKDQIERIRAIRDRSVTYVKGSDKIILSDTKCFIL